MSFTLWIVGFIVLIAGLAYGASLAGVSAQWIGVGAIVLAGIGIVMGVTNTRTKDVSHT